MARLLTEDELYILNQTLQNGAVVEIKSTGETGLVKSQHSTFFNRAYYMVELENGKEKKFWKDEIKWVGNLNF